MMPDTFLVGPAVLAALSVPLILKVVPRNRIYGWRTPKTMADEALWFRANSFAGWAFLMAAGASAALLYALHSGVLPPVVPEILGLVFPVSCAVAACFVYQRRIEGNASGGRNDG